MFSSFFASDNFLLILRMFHAECSLLHKENERVEQKTCLKGVYYALVLTL